MCWTSRTNISICGLAIYYARVVLRSLVVDCPKPTFIDMMREACPYSRGCLEQIFPLRPGPSAHPALRVTTAPARRARNPPGKSVASESQGPAAGRVLWFTGLWARALDCCSERRAKPEPQSVWIRSPRRARSVRMLWRRACVAMQQVFESHCAMQNSCCNASIIALNDQCIGSAWLSRRSADRV